MYFIFWSVFLHVNDSYIRDSFAGVNVDISTSCKGGLGEKDTAPYCRQTHSHHLRPGVSSVIPRMMSIPDPKKRTVPHTPLPRGEKITEPILGCDSPVSPVIGSRRLLVGTGSLPYIFRTRKQVSLNSEGFDKENQNVSPKDSGACVTLPSALCEKKNIMCMEKGINCSQVQHGNISKNIGTKRKTIAEKENFSTTCQFPVRKSKRTKNETKPLMQLMQDGTKTSPRKDLAKEGKGHLKTNVSSAGKVPESKQIQLRSRIEDIDSQFLSKRTSKRVRKNLNFTAKQDSQGMQRIEVNEEKDKSLRRIMSMEQRTQKKDLSSERSERTASNKEATMLTCRIVNRKVDKKNSSPQTKVKGIKDKQKSYNEKIRNSPAASMETPKSIRKVNPFPGEVVQQTVTGKNHARKLLSKSTVDNHASQHSKSIDVVALSKSKQNKQKLPIWALKGNTVRTPGKRKSIRVINKDVYEFKFDSTEEVAKKGCVLKRRNQRRRKKPKPQTTQTLLTTDPNWEDPLSSLNPFPVVSSSSRGDIEYIRVNVNSSVRESHESVVSSLNSSLREGKESVGSSVNSSCREDSESPGASITSEYNVDDDFDTHDNQDDVFDGYEFETLSSFVTQQDPSDPIPMTSASVSNTPAIASHISKYIGGSSTPRVENTLLFTSSHDLGELQAPKTVKDDIATCFGFDDSNTEAEDSELSLSPVRCSGLQSNLEMTSTSDNREICSHSEASRFSWCSLKPGCQSYVSASCSSSMLVHDCSLSSLSSSSSTVQPKISTFKRTELGKSVVLQRKKVEESHLDGEIRRKTKTKRNLSQPVTSKPREYDSEDTNTSVLFEEKEVMESQMKLDEEDQCKSSQKDHFSEGCPPQLSQTSECQSLEESFSKVSI